MRETVQNLKKVYQFGKAFRLSVLISTAASFLFIIVNVIYPLFTAKQITYLTSGIFQQLILASVIILVFDMLEGIRMFLIRKNTQIFFRGTFKKLQLAVSKEILNIKLSELEQHSSGVFIERLNKDCNELSHIFTVGVGNLTGILNNLGIFVAIFIINRYLFIFYLSSSLIVTLLYLNKVKKVNYKDKMLRIEKEKNIGLTSELVRGVRDIKMLNAANSFIEEIDHSIQCVSDKTFAMRNIEISYNLVIKIITAILEFTLIMLLIFLVKIGNINLATAVVLFSYRSNIMTNLMEKVGNLMEEIKTFNLSSKRVFSIFDNKEFKKEQFGNIHLDSIKGNVNFQDVTFAYENGKKYSII